MDIAKWRDSVVSQRHADCTSAFLHFKIAIAGFSVDLQKKEKRMKEKHQNFQYTSRL